MANIIMEAKPKLQLNENWLRNSAVYSVGCLLVPITIYSSDTLFKRFCGFHNRKLRLENKSPKRIFVMAVGMSILYSTVSLNLYYRGLMKIIGINSIYDVEGILSDEFKDEGEKQKELTNS
jgi:hypothetical protein